MLSLAYAAPADSGDASLIFIMEMLGCFAGAAVLGATLVLVAWSRRHRQADGVLVAAIVWALLAGGLAAYYVDAEDNWAKEQDTRLRSGYGDPNDMADAPQPPWMMAGGMALAYLGMLGWVFLASSGPARGT